MHPGSTSKYVVVLYIGNYGSGAGSNICMVANSCFPYTVKLTMTASLLTILAILRTFTFNSHKSVECKIQLLLLYKEKCKWKGEQTAI
jgi:hypothetical protein